MNLPEVLFARNTGGSGGSGNKKLAAWDFTVGLTDSVNGFTATLSGATRDENGLHFDSATDSCTIPSFLMSIARTFIIETGNFTAGAFNNGALLTMLSSGSSYYEGLSYHTGTSKWAVWDHINGWNDSDISDPDYFANSVVKIMITPERKMVVYKDDELVFESSSVLPFVITDLCLGSKSNNTFYDMNIKKLEVRG